MRIHPHAPGTVLFDLADLDLSAPPPELANHLDPVRTVVRWAEDYLCRPHRELGRSGPVCPYVQASMRKGLFFLSVVPGNDLTQEDVAQHIVGFRDWFLELPPQGSAGDAGLKTILVLFPDVPQERVPELIDATQAELKPQYVPRGLMIGEFHAGPPDKGGLWNPDFRPLQSPVPMLVIRHMVPTDFAFLREEKDFVQAYLDVYGDQVPAHLRSEVRETARRFGLSLPGGLESVHPRVAAALEKHGIAATVHRHRDMPQPQNGPADVARALDWPLDRITKSLFLRSRDGGYVVVVCPVNRRADLGEIADRLDCGRLEMATQQELSAWLGFSPGGVSPIATPDVRVVMDEALFQYETILTAAGEVAVEIEIGPGDLQRVTGATVLSMGRIEA